MTSSCFVAKARPNEKMSTNATLMTRAVFGGTLSTPFLASTAVAPAKPAASNAHIL